MYRHDLLEPLAARLAELTPGAIDTFFFANSGAEITEAAVKLAKQVTGRPNVIVFSGSFHGRTHLAMAMTTSKTIYRAGHAPLPAGVFVAPFPDPLAPTTTTAEVARALHGFDHLLKTMTAPDETAAMILEPVLGEGGYVPGAGGVPRTASSSAAVRTGSCSSPTRCRPGSVAPATHVRRRALRRRARRHLHGQGHRLRLPVRRARHPARADDRWPTGSHGGTYGGNPIGCAAALATIDVLTAPGFLDDVRARGEQLRAGLPASCSADDAGVRAGARARA